MMRLNRWTWLAVGVGIAAHGVAGRAHHSIAGVYDRNRPATIEGVVSEVRFVNPHPLVIVDVEDDAGRAQPWTLELDNQWELADIGFKADTLRPGDRVVVRGSLARREPHRLYVYRLDRPADGLRYEQVGSRPRLDPG